MYRCYEYEQKGATQGGDTCQVLQFIKKAAPKADATRSKAPTVGDENMVFTAGDKDILDANSVDIDVVKQFRDILNRGDVDINKIKNEVFSAIRGGDNIQDKLLDILNNGEKK